MKKQLVLLTLCATASFNAFGMKTLKTRISNALRIQPVQTAFKNTTARTKNIVNKSFNKLPKVSVPKLHIKNKAQYIKQSLSQGTKATKEAITNAYSKLPNIKPKQKNELSIANTGILYAQKNSIPKDKLFGKARKIDGFVLAKKQPRLNIFKRAFLSTLRVIGGNNLASKFERKLRKKDSPEFVYVPVETLKNTKKTKKLSIDGKQIYLPKNFKQQLDREVKRFKINPFYFSKNTPIVNPDFMQKLIKKGKVRPLKRKPNHYGHGTNRVVL